MDSKEIYSRLNKVFRDVFDDDSISVTPKTTADDIEDIIEALSRYGDY